MGGCVVVRWSVPAEMARTRCAIRTSRHTRLAQISLAVRYQDIEAYAVRPDLARGTADFTRVKSASVAENETRVIADVMAAAAIAEEDGDDISGDMRDGQALASA